MVRIFKVTHLEERRRRLLERSAAHRQAIRSDIAGLQASVDGVRHVANSIRSSWRRWAGIAALVGILVARGRKGGERTGFLSRVLSGIRLGGELIAILRKFQSQSAESPEHDGRAESVDA